MRPSRRLAALVIGGLALLALAAGATLYFWPRRPHAVAEHPREVPPTPKAHKIQLADRSFDSAAYLVRLKNDRLDTPAGPFWDGLFVVMARDPDTTGLLRRL